MPEALRVGDPPIEVRLRRDPRARRLILRLARGTGSPVLTLPPGLPLATARAFLTANGVPDAAALVVKAGLIVVAVFIQQRADRS